MGIKVWLLLLKGAVRNLPRTYSDHCPMIVYTEGTHLPNPSLRPFVWKPPVQEYWLESNNPILEVILYISSNAFSWNKSIFGNVFQLLGRIEGIQKAQSNKFSHNLFILEKELAKEYNNILYQEELLWFQKSRAN
ncbi:hypothetical protein ACSBR2_041192 [Camellia fascicularis]